MAARLDTEFAIARLLHGFSISTIAFAWSAFVVSFFLPTTNVLSKAGTPPGAPLTGWEACAGSFVLVALNPWAWLAGLAEPRIFLLLLFPFANVLVLLCPVLAFVLREKSAVLGLLVLPCSVIPWILPRELTGDLYVGFYCWNISFVAMSMGCFLVSCAHGVEHHGVE